VRKKGDATRFSVCELYDRVIFQAKFLRSKQSNNSGHKKLCLLDGLVCPAAERQALPLQDTTYVFCLGAMPFPRH
jgi:hypothetical protein